MAIPTPKDLYNSQTIEWQTKAEQAREAMLKKVEEGVSKAVDLSLKAGNLTADGGSIEYRASINLESNGYEIEEIRYLLKKRGWESHYAPYSHDAGGHRDSSCYLTEHKFYLKPRSLSE